MIFARACLVPFWLAKKNCRNCSCEINFASTPSRRASAIACLTSFRIHGARREPFSETSGSTRRLGLKRAINFSILGSNCAFLRSLSANLFDPQLARTFGCLMRANQDIHRLRFGINRFRVLTVTTISKRVQSLVEACSQLQSGHGLFLFADKSILSGDILSGTWQTGRPGETTKLLG